MTEKYAGILNWAGKGLHHAGDAATKADDAIIRGAKALANGYIRTNDAIAKPASGLFEALNRGVQTLTPDITRRLPESLQPASEAITPYVAPLVIPAGIVGGISVLNRDAPSNSYTTDFSQASQGRGYTMANKFASFVAEKRQIERTKISSAGLTVTKGTFGRAGASGLTDLLKRLTHRRVVTPGTAAVGEEWITLPPNLRARYEDASKGSKALSDDYVMGRIHVDDAGNIKTRNPLYKPAGEPGEELEFAPVRTALGVTGLIGAGALMDVGDSVVDPLAGTEGYKINKQMNSLWDRVEGPDTFAKSFLQASGKNVSDIMANTITESVNSAGNMAAKIPQNLHQNQLFQEALRGDGMLRDASPQDKEMLRRAYSSMQKFAPELASDEFATKNYLREALMASNGPDYSTLANMARANRDASPTPSR